MVSGGKGLTLLVATVAAGLFAMGGVRGYQVLAAKTGEQDLSTESLERWSKSYLALGESRARWVRSYRREDNAQDVLSLIGLAGLEAYGLIADADSVVLTSLEQVNANGAPIGLTRICMGTGSADGGGLVVHAASYDALLHGVERLAKRKDVSLGNITVQGDKVVPLANLGDFCLLLRND